MAFATPSEMKAIVTKLYVLVVIVSIIGCDEDVLVFPTPPSAYVQFINVTQDIATLSVVVDASDSVDVPRGSSSGFVPAAAGRPVGIMLKQDTSRLRDTLYYTLGGSARVLLFTRGSKSNVVEFRRAIQDTTLPAGSDPVIRFTHMAENVNRFSTVEVWISGGSKIFDEEFDPGFTSTSYISLPTGTYSFEIREAGTTNVAARISNVQLESGRSYMLYTYDDAPPALDMVTLAIF